MTGSALDELDDLLAYMAEGKVIPVVDAGSLLVGEGDQRQPLESLLARRLAERLRIDPTTLPTALRLDDVVRRQRAQPRKDNLHLHLRVQLLKDLDIAPPQALLDLAAIPAFDLIVSVSCDDLLQRVLDQVRHGGDARTEVIAFAPNRAADLAKPRDDSRRSRVFQLLGRISSSPDSVISDDDRLEFLHALQDDARRPKLLFDALRDSHLLLLGCQLPDWVARFFLRTVKREQLSKGDGGTVEILVGAAAVGGRHRPLRCQGTGPLHGRQLRPLARRRAGWRFCRTGERAFRRLPRTHPPWLSRMSRCGPISTVPARVSGTCAAARCCRCWCSTSSKRSSPWARRARPAAAPCRPF